MKKAGFAIFFVMLAALASAAPMPLLMIANNNSMQCARFLPGDECMDCTPPVGWEVLGPYSSCPEGYTMVTVNGNCKGFEQEHCCTEKHSGASGDCQNMVMKNLTKQCAFLTNARDASLPAGWMKMPANASSSNWVCPLDYTWTTLAATATISSNAAQYGPVNVVSVKNDADFQVNSGNYVSGWTWLREPGQFAAWTFYNLPTDRRLYIYLAPLATRPSGNGGGSGYSTDVRINYQSRTGSINATVSLKNTHPEFKMPADTMGWGYQTFGYLMIPADKIPLDGKITVTLTKYPNAEHVAVNKECCNVEYI